MIVQIEPWIDQVEVDEIGKVLNSTFITEGEATRKFEGLISAYTGAKHAIAMFNGTMALYAVLRVLGVKEGDEVIVPDLTFIATANSVLFAGAKPIFCDIDPVTLCIDIEKAKSLITKRTRAIMPVQLYGLSAEMDDLRKLCASEGLFLVEDAAQGIGVKYKGRHVGTFGDAGILSFYGNKTITTGEGGIILTNDDKIATDCYRLKNHGRSKKGVFIHEEIGLNLSFTDLQAAIGIAQMSKLERIIRKKAAIREQYLKTLSDVKEIKFQSIPSHIEAVFWFTNIYAEDVDSLAGDLAAHDIGTRRFFYPLHKQPCYQNLYPNECQVSYMAYQKGLSLPSSYNLSAIEIEEVCSTVRRYYGR